MPVPSSLNDLSTTPASNSPAGSETPTEGDNYIRTLSAFIATLRDKLNGTAATGTVKDATFSGTHTFSSGNLIAGTYTPTFAGVSNVSTVLDSNSARYLRMGNTVTVSGMVTVSPTAAAQTILGVSLPIASAMTANHQVSGVCANGALGVSGSVNADDTNDRAQLVFNAVSTASHSMSYHFTYVVI